MVQIRSLLSSEKLPLISTTKIPKAKYAKMSYKAPYLLLANQSTVEIFVLQSAPSISLQPAFTIQSPGLDNDFVVVNVRPFFIETRIKA